MKKALVAAILGIALKATVAHGQGYIIMESYKLVGGTTPVFSAVTYGPGSGALTGKYVGAASGFKADLLFSLNGGSTYTLASGSSTAFFAGSTDNGSPTTDGAGVFVGGSVTIPGYTSGPATFEVRAYNGATFGAPGSYNGVSAPFTIASLQTDPLQSAGTIMNLSGTTVQGIQPFVVSIPEPSIFALAGLGAAGLMAFRRKK
jgi:hypothetical protein